MTPRLATSVWVAALLRRAAAEGVYGAVLRKGDPEGGAVILVLRARDGCLTAWSRVAQPDGSVWAISANAAPDDTHVVDQYLTRQTQFDPDLWIVELVGDEMQPFVVELSQTR